MSRPFASTDDRRARPAQLEELAPGVLAFTAQGDPNVGAIVGSEAVLCVDARATPVAAGPWLAALRDVTDKPIEYLVLTHYHAVRTLGASALAPRHVVAHELTARWIAERGEQDRESELRRFPRLFDEPDSIPGLTRPDVLVADRLTVCLGDREVELRWLGPGHTAGDLVVWLPAERVLFAGDLVENRAAPYAGDAAIESWTTRTLAGVAALDADVLVPGRGAPVRGADVAESIARTRDYLNGLWESVLELHAREGDLAAAFLGARSALEGDFGDWFIFEHCLPFNVARAFDEAGGLPPQVWTAERDRELWSRLSAD